jgi:hypothetical protein
MAISRVAGQMLKSNLERDGVDLAVDTDLLYLDVGNNRVGINTSAPTVALEVTGNILSGNINTGGLISATGNATGGNILTGGLISATGNVTGGNIRTVGLISSTGNVTGGNVLTGGLISATGNVTGGNVLTGGLISSTGNATAGNVLTGGLISSTGNVTGGNIIVGNILLPGTGNITVGNVKITNVATPTANADAATKLYVDEVVGNVRVTGNITFSNTIISTNLANGNITLTSTGTGLVTIAGTAGIIVPAGNTAQRPNPPTTSTLRVNTELTQLEYYDGSNWVSSAGDTSAITNQTLNGDGSTVIFTLDYEATAESILVSINGVLQTPGIDYTTTGTTLTFTTAPAAGDVIQVRFIAAITVISALVNGTSNIGIPTSSGNVTIGSGGTANVLVVDPTGVTITGNLTVSGNATLSGNILGDRIQNGTTTIDIQSVNGNANITVAGTSNVAVFATAGVFVTGVVSATANITGGNVLTGGLISATANITGGNLSVGTGTITVGNVVNSNGNGVGNIGSSSTYFNTVFAKATSAQYADLAELYSADAAYTPGTVVSFGGDREITLTTLDTDPCVAGVVSTNPAHLMNSGIFCEFPTALALQGRVPCRVVGHVTAGAMMVSAGNGCARAEKSPAMGAVIGKAVENFSENMPGIIEIVVGRL